MLNALNLLTSIKPPAINPVSEVRPVGPIQGDPRQGFSGLLQQAAQQATQQRATQQPPAPQANRPTAPRPTPQATAPRPQPAPAQKPPAASASPKAAAPEAQARHPDANEAAGRRDGSTRTERTALDSLRALLEHQPTDAQDPAHASSLAFDAVGEEGMPGIEATEQAALVPGVDTPLLPNPTALATDPALTPLLASSLSALADARAEDDTTDTADLSAGAAGESTGDLGAVGGMAAADAAAQGSIELADDTALAMHETFQQALAEGQMQGDEASAATLRQASGAAAPAVAEAGASASGSTTPVHGAALASGPTLSSTSSAPSAAANAASHALGTPVDSPDFPQAMATQISYFVREGIQQAQLHLNPAEMGPVSVQIALNGQQAQVDFAAASSATRAAIENSLSDLAASLQSAGFTLTGGGVSQQSQQSQQSPHQASGQAGNETRPGQRHGQGDAVEAAGTQTVLHHSSTAGGLDLYA